MRGLTLTEMTVIPNVGAAACTSWNWRTLEALSGFQRKATRETVGIASLRICSRLAPTSGPRMVLPVIFPPGRARLGTSRARTGSPIEIMTMGIVVVACLAAKLAGVPKVAMTSTGRRTSDIAYGVLGRPASDEADYRRWLLRTRRGRRRRRHAAE